MDRRIEKTKEKIHQGLLVCLAGKDFRDITVKELCAAAQVNRSTFYVYYDNVAECFEELSETIVREMKEEFYRQPGKDPEAYLRAYFQTARRHQTVFLAVHSMGIHNTMIRKMAELFNEVLHEELFVPEKNENLLYSYYFSGFYGMVETWLKNGCRESDEELISVMRRAARAKL